MTIKKSEFLKKFKIFLFFFREMILMTFRISLKFFSFFKYITSTESSDKKKHIKFSYSNSTITAALSLFFSTEVKRIGHAPCCYLLHGCLPTALISNSCFRNSPITRDHSCVIEWIT